MRLEHLLSGGTQGERQEIARGSHLKRSVASPGFLDAAVCLIIGKEGSRAFVAPRLEAQLAGTSHSGEEILHDVS